MSDMTETEFQDKVAEATQRVRAIKDIVEARWILRLLAERFGQELVPDLETAARTAQQSDPTSEFAQALLPDNPLSGTEQFDYEGIARRDKAIEGGFAPFHTRDEALVFSLATTIALLLEETHNGLSDLLSADEWDALKAIRARYPTAPSRVETTRPRT